MRLQFPFAVSGRLCGSKRRQRAKSSWFAGLFADAIGRSTFNFALPGMQILSQTSQLASAESFTDDLSILAEGVICCMSKTSSW